MKRHLFKLVLFLLLGAAVNVAVAWGCAAWLDVDGKNYGHAILFSPDLAKDWAWDIRTYETLGAVRIKSDSVGSGFFAAVRKEQGADAGRKELELAIEKYMVNPFLNRSAKKIVNLPSWSRANDPPQSTLKADYRIEDARGWPFLTLRCSIDDSTIRLRMGDPMHFALINPSRIAEVFDVQDDRILVRNKSGKLLKEIMLAEGDAVRNGILLPVNIIRNGIYDIRALPIYPIWPGFAMNTIFFATIVWLIAFAPFKLRRYVRYKRGHCIKCGYDLRGDTSKGCPECGWGREAEG